MSINIVTAVLVAVLALAIALLVFIPRYARERLRQGAGSPPSRFEEFAAATELRRVVVEAVAAVLLLIGAFIAFNEYRTTKERQDSERFVQVVELLGSPDATTRIGGVYGLEGVARSDDSYYPILDDTLSALIRSTAPYPGDPEANPPDVADPVIQAAIRVLGRVPDRPERELDLSRSDLHHIDFRGGDFRNALFRDANLADVLAAGANFRGADFTDTVVGEELCRDGGAELGDNPGLPALGC